MTKEGERELFNKINDQLKAALKSKDEMRLSVLRMIKSKILYVNARGDLPEAEVIKIIKKYSNELKDSITEFTKVNRSEEVKKHEQELKIVQEFLPKELSPEEIKKLVQQTISETGASSIKDMGRVMKEVLARQPGIDAKTVSQFVREFLK